MNIVKATLALVLGVLITGCDKKITLENSYTFSQVGGGNHTSEFDPSADAGPFIDGPRADAYWQGRIEYYHLARKFDSPTTFRIDYNNRQASTYSPTTCVDAPIEFCQYAQAVGGGYYIFAVLNFSNTGVIYGGAVGGYSPDDNNVDSTHIIGKIGSLGLAGAFHGTGISGGFYARP